MVESSNLVPVTKFYQIKKLSNWQYCSYFMNCKCKKNVHLGIPRSNKFTFFFQEPLIPISAWLVPQFQKFWLDLVLHWCFIVDKLTSLLSFIKSNDPPTIDQPTTDHLLTDPPTNRPPTYRSTDPIITDPTDKILFQRLDQ